MEKAKITIIGAGIVGLAIASRLSSKYKDIILLERYDSFGRETSSRNSEVIHAGFYYPSESLKAKLCVNGNRMMYGICEKNNIPYKKTGKIVIANTIEEKEKIYKLLKQGQKNCVDGISIIGKKEIEKMEPFIKAEEGLWSPSTGIVDSHLLMKYFESTALSNSVIIGYNCCVNGIEKKNGGFFIKITDADGEEIQINSEIVINCAGLNSDKIAQMAGIDIIKENCVIHPCKGEYFSVSNRHKGKLTHLVYPAPTNISLGIHAVLKLDGCLKLGPNAFYVDKIDYNVDASHIDNMYKEAKKYLPFIDLSDLSCDQSGIRPKLQQANEAFRDFIICEESNKGLPGLVNLIGIESPGLTAAPAIAEYVENMIKGLV